MKEKEECAASTRAVGQRSLFFNPNRFATRNESRDSLQNKIKTSNTTPTPCISLSDFLNRKLHQTTPSKTVQSKLKPFGSSSSLDTDTRRPVGVKKRDSRQIEEKVFEMFKCPRRLTLLDFGKHVCDAGLSSRKEGAQEISNQRHHHHLRRRTTHYSSNVSSPGERKPTPPYVLSLGDDGKCNQNSREVCFSEGNKPKPVFDHYANGGGWWDCDMEGLDSGVVCNEVWEGMGSTTLGGLDWH
ncbi:hypothetical protein Syun_030488 [Stephania yunnanensis]|uniref:Uncharacterized protein n=1 Tax=Stephania yunnanensis TaxID=152371 RepID=A0AAP0HIA4_9MAGN